MIDSFVLLAPLLMIPVVALVCFVGCDVVFGLTRVPDGPAPTGLNATPGDGKIVVSWDTYPNATAYTLQRGETSGVYTATFNIASTATSYTDGNLTNGTTYFYVLSEASSLPSEEVSAIPSAAAKVPFVISFDASGAAVATTAPSGSYGMQIVIGTNPITIKTLGRAFLPGNNQIHVIKLLDASGADVPGAFAAVSMAGGTDGQFVYGALNTPANCNPGETFFIVSKEEPGLDGFYNHTLTVLTTDAAVVQSAARGGPPYVADNAGLHSYGPLSFEY